jgi:NADH-quinone oxidoreductase subunit H
VSAAHLLAAGDPLYQNGVNWTVLGIVAIKVLLGFGICLISVTLMIWFERKVISDMQSRVGPNRAGPWGLLQTLADGIKLFFKEDLVPDRADRFVFKLAPFLSLVPALVVFAIIPVGGVITIGSYTTELQVADPPIGILLALAMGAIGVYGVMLAGWASGSKYPLMSSVRASAQMISYEAALGMTVLTVVLVTGSLSTRTMVDSQGGGPWHWNVIRLGIVPFVIFITAAVAETNRPPFDVVEADSELVGGFHTEYSSIRFALFYLAEFLNTVTMSAIMVTLFFGGPNGYVPPIPGASIVVPILWFLLKTVAFCYVFVWLRGALPRSRYDKLMDLGWRRLIPLSLGWMLLVAGFLISPWWGISMAVAIVLGGLVLSRTFVLGSERELSDEAVLPPVAERLVPPELVRELSDEDGEERER